MMKRKQLMELDKTRKVSAGVSISNLIPTSSSYLI